MKFFAGALLIFVSFSCLGDAAHVAIALFFSFSRALLHTADLFTGIPFRIGAGMSLILLDPFSTAIFASLSASSLPSTPSWPGTHLMVRDSSRCCLLTIFHRS